MTTAELTMIGLLIAIASQTTYTSYSTWKNATQARGTSIFVDTSVLMDGRIISIAETGFIPGTLVIPRSVIGEMQFLADNADSEKRERARRGLDVARQLQTMEGVQVELHQDGSKAEEGVDERLLKLAKEFGGMLMTIDFNLNKVAQVEDIRVLNVNDLARQLRMVYLPGDTLSLELSSQGSDKHQAVGHLDDGTMVVVEQSSKLVGQTVQIEIIRSLQTAAGRMMFAKRIGQESASHQTLESSSNSSSENRAHQSDKKPQSHSSATANKSTQSTRGRSPKKTTNVNAKSHQDQSSARPKQHPQNEKGTSSQGTTSKASTASNSQRNKRSGRPRTSSQREESLIQLVNGQ